MFVISALCDHILHLSKLVNMGSLLATRKVTDYGYKDEEYEDFEDEDEVEECDWSGIGVDPPLPALLPTYKKPVKSLAILTLYVHHPPPGTSNHTKKIKNYGNLSEFHTIGISAGGGLIDQQIGVKMAELHRMFDMLKQSVATHKEECARWGPWSTQPYNKTLISITLMDLRVRAAPTPGTSYGLKSCDYVWIQVANDLVNQFRVMKDAWEEEQAE